MKLTPKYIFAIKMIIHLLSLSFVGLLVFQTLSGGLGADPAQGISHYTGKAALNTLIITSLISPLAKFFRQGRLIKVRRLIGLYSFFWAVLHLLGYLALDLNFNWPLLASELASRPYLTLGAASWLILLVLTVTSPQKIQRRLGSRWQKLHNWIYLALILSPIHYYWSVKSGLTEPVLYILATLILLSLRYKTFMRWLPAFFALSRTTSPRS
ncbi:protein-methionine-sulfoxide reductase heme-binding subunit MsrQ [uncultured Photobacterium sp.]|uniref:protein-methionine-sulfoxide reductase heme-binding subunit MsrQ n=1 Tax=uncultured Photobacterium sp. TaxID=173973 RepID=UPI002635687F|nr:protein-methionine-sulfoxide reductase heme-binding subunit MsrQ [uncultured Photobacterium sp.]